MRDRYDLELLVSKLKDDGATPAGAREEFRVLHERHRRENEI